VEDWFANPGNPDFQAEADGEDWMALLQDFDGVMEADGVSATTDGRFHQLSPLQIGSTTDESTTSSATTDVAMVPAVSVESTTGSSATDVAMVLAVGVESATGSNYRYGNGSGGRHEVDFQFAYRQHDYRDKIGYGDAARGVGRCGDR
jgi:hypothetical protein